MKVCILQCATVPANREANQNIIQALAQQAMQQQPDILVLPELWDIGFYPTQPLSLGDEGGEQAQKFLHHLARQHHVHIVGGSIARRQGNLLWNTGYVYDREGTQLAAYDKMHLFSPAGEHNAFQPGTHTVSFTLDNVPASMIICYDLRFCELGRVAALAGAHMLFVCAAWPKARLAHWQLLNQARAVENQYFVISANCCSDAENKTFAGHSLIIDPWGTILAEADEHESLLVASCDLTKVNDSRKRIPVLTDRKASYPAPLA